ncbi:nucleolar protein 58-like [Palaemon carinicauda]|uniref:nucleolar protein 58-like n=1 Tax=Palaemon carinicauda TaxID=392227 RepID=UPI0035B5A421
MTSLKEELEGGDKKKGNRPGIRKVKLNKTSLEISTEMDVKDGQKEDVQKDVRDNKSEEKVVEAEDQDANGRKAEKGALGDTNNRQEEQKLQKETSRDEEKEEEEEKKKEEKIAKKTTRKPIVFDLEPKKPKGVISSSDSSHITFQGEKEEQKMKCGVMYCNHKSIHDRNARAMKRVLKRTAEEAIQHETDFGNGENVDEPHQNCILDSQFEDTCDNTYSIG